MAYRDYNDYELVDLVMETNEDANTIIYKKYYPAVIDIAIKHYSMAEDKGLEPNDLIQEGLIGLCHAINNYRDSKDAQFFTFATLCIERAIKTAIRNAGRQQNKPLNTAISYDEAPKQNESILNRLWDTKYDPINIIATDENAEKIKNIILKRLTPAELKVFNLKLSNHTNHEIAKELNKSIKTVYNTLSRIRIKINKVIKMQNTKL